jgi:hypothetical protein
MNIGDITNGGLPSSKRLKQRQVDQITPVDVRNNTPETPDARNAQLDSVAISEEARRALAEDQKRLQEFEQARQALDDVPSLSEERKQEIRERISSAYYSKPEILTQIASRITQNLGESNNE